MGFWFLEGFGEQDTAIVEEIAKVHKVDVKVVEKHYKEMLKGIANEVKSA